MIKIFHPLADGTASLFWNRGSSSSEQIDIDLVRIEAGSTVLKASATPMSVSLQAPDIISATATPPEGADVALPADGIIMYNYQKVTLNVNNPIGALMGLKLIAEPFGKIAPFAPDPASGWQYSALEGAYYYALPAAGGTISVALPLVDENNGGHVKLETYYYMVQDPGTDDQLAEKVTLDTLEFDIVNFQIKSIAFINRQKLNIDANNKVPTPEWFREAGRTKKPQVGVQYHATTTSPAAVIKDAPLKLRVAYNCHGEDEIKLSAICDLDSQPSCIYGNTIMPWTTISCAAGSTVRAVDVETIYSSTVVRPSMIHIVWNTKDAKIGSRINTTTEYNVDTWHRIYTLNSSPKRIGWNSTAWVPILELGTNLADGATGDFTLRRNLQEGIYNSSWQAKWQTNKIYFLNHLFSIIYNSNGESFTPEKTGHIPFIVNFYYSPFYLQDMLDFLLTTPESPKIIDCYSYNGLFLIASNQLGTPMFGRFIDRKIEDNYLNTRCLLPSGLTEPGTSSFTSHFVVADDAWPYSEYWDATNLYHALYMSMNPCPSLQGNNYIFARDLEPAIYLDSIFTDTDYYTAYYFFSSLDKRRPAEP